MSKENKNGQEKEPIPWSPRVKKLARIAIRVSKSKAAEHVTKAAKYSAGVAAGAVMVYGVAQVADRDYEFKGDHPVQIGTVGGEDGTVREAMFNNIEGVNGANIGETTEHVREDPRNENLRDADGMIVDTGATVYMPKSVKEQ